MLEKTYFLEENNGYKKYNHFEISSELESILSDDYYLYDSKEFDKSNLVEELYENNFINKYDKDTQKEIFELYINNEQFKQKAKFVYSIIDYEKYAKFVLENKELENPNELTIKYSILDSQGVKVQIYFINIIDISFVF